ncbi:MAG: hypothetical protein PVF79_09085 [Desulfobacterales bacterium]|jgi:hypothetical protein
MQEQDIYEKFIQWLGRTWWELPQSDQLMPMITARYSVEEAEFLTGYLQGLRTVRETLPDGCDSAQIFRCGDQ